MTRPLDLLVERCEEIATRLKQAKRNNLDSKKIDKIIEYYNTYFIAIQLLESHTEIYNNKLLCLSRKMNSWNYRYLDDVRNQVRITDKKFKNN